MTMRRLACVAAAIVGAIGISGCGTDRPKPQPLAPVAQKIEAKELWKLSFGSVQFPLALAVNGNTITLATTGGDVAAIDVETGRELWRGHVDAKLSAGVGSDGNTAAVVTRDGELVALASGGKVKWKKMLIGRVATAPLVAGERIFVLGIDRTVQSFDAETGRLLWTAQRPGDALTLAQGGVLGAYRDSLIVGQGPRMAALDPNNGSVRWEVVIGSPRGANELERLADLVGPATRIGDFICARSFQAAVGCIDASRGVAVWTKTVGGTDAIAGDAQTVFAADANDRMSAWRTATGEVVWTSEALQYRQLSAPAVTAGSVVYGDNDGTLHWFTRDRGISQLRLNTDGSPIQIKPLVIGTTLVVVTRSGNVYAFRTP